MATALLIYHSNDGQTEAIISRIRDHLAATMDVEMRPIHHNPPQDFSGYDGVFIGAAIRYGHFHKDIVAYATAHAQALNALPSAFMGVCLTARKPEKRSVETNVYLRKFLARAGWQPQTITAVAGALLYPRYGLFDRLAIQMIMRITGGETDTSKEVVFTDWQQVEELAARFRETIVATS